MIDFMVGAAFGIFVVIIAMAFDFRDEVCIDWYGGYDICRVPTGLIE